MDTDTRLKLLELAKGMTPERREGEGKVNLFASTATDTVKSAKVLEAYIRSPVKADPEE